MILVIDEIQKIKDWSSVVKMLWDEDTRLRVPLKVILTGSSALLLQKGLLLCEIKRGRNHAKNERGKQMKKEQNRVCKREALGASLLREQ